MKMIKILNKVADVKWIGDFKLVAGVPTDVPEEVLDRHNTAILRGMFERHELELVELPPALDTAPIDPVAPVKPADPVVPVPPAPATAPVVPPAPPAPAIDPAKGVDDAALDALINKAKAP